MTPKVTLIAAPQDPDHLVSVIWQVSKTTEEVDFNAYTPGLLRKLINEDVPVLRHLKFTFIIEDMSISFREQLVRTQWDDYWIQSGRITNWVHMLVPVPDAASKAGLYSDWYEAVGIIKSFIAKAKQKDLTPEEYRDIVPVGALHRGAWTVNLQSLLTRLRKRSCWVAQADKWTPVLQQVTQQLADYNKAFVNMCRPPCVDSNWEYRYCTVKQTMKDRVCGTDPLPVCPIFAWWHGGGAVDDLIHTNVDHVSSLENLWRQDITEAFGGHGDDRS